MKKLFAAIASIIALVSLTGCSAFLIGAGTAGTVGVGIDTIRLERFVDFEQAWTATTTTLEELEATTTSVNQGKGIIEAEDANENEIIITIGAWEERATAIDVSVRRKGLPNLKHADLIVETINEKFRRK